MIRRIVTVVGTTLVALVLMASAAFAHFCTNVNRSDMGNAKAAGSNGWVSATELAGFTTFLGCGTEAQAWIDSLVAAGQDPDLVLTHAVTTAARGVAGTSKSFDQRGIDHMLTAEFLAMVTCAFDEE